VKPRTVPDGRSPIAVGPSNPPLTSPNKYVMKIGTFGLRHISTTGVTLHRSLKKADLF
jgi:hypothetical protein